MSRTWSETPKTGFLVTWLKCPRCAGYDYSTSLVSWPSNDWLSSISLIHLVGVITAKYIISTELGLRV